MIDESDLPRSTPRLLRTRFLIVGAWNTVAGYGIFLLLYLALVDHWHYLPIAVVSHFIAVLNAWLGYRHWVFDSTAAPWPEYLRFNLASILLVLLQLAILTLLAEGFGMHPLGAQVISVVCSVFASYLTHNRFSFAAKPPPP
jgi:putative flippase GtrA